MAKGRIVFHIGLEKTATTSFQRFCAENQALLRRRGLLYPKRTMGRGINHKLLASSYVTDQPKDRAFALNAPPRADLVRAVLDEAKASAAEAMLISAEHMSSRFEATAVAALAEDFSGFDVEVLVVVRDHHARFLSSYSTHILGGGRTTMEEYEKAILAQGGRYLSVEDTLAPWEAIFGRRRIRVLDYDAEPNIVVALLQGCGLQNVDVDPSRYRDVTSPRPAFLRMLQAVHCAIERRQTMPADDNDAAWLQLMAFSTLLRRRIARATGSDDGGAWRVSARAIETIEAIAMRDRAWLKRHHGLDMRGSNGRDRMIVADATPDGLSDPDLMAERLVADIPPALWGLSEVLVRLHTGARRLRARPRGVR